LNINLEDQENAFKYIGTYKKYDLSKSFMCNVKERDNLCFDGFEDNSKFYKMANFNPNIFLMEYFNELKD